MAIINTLLLQDVVKHGGRKLMIWTILLVVGCIQYAHAVKPTEVTIVHTTGGTQVPNTRTWYADATTDITLTCSANGGATYLFKRFGTAITSHGGGGDGWGVAAITVALTDKDNAGMYTCTSRDASSVVADDDAEPLILSLTCTEQHEAACAGDANSKCAGSATTYCQCKHGAADKAGVFPECLTCAKGGYDGCDKSNHQICKKDGSACKCEHGGNIGSCNECADDGDCSGVTPRCDTTANPNECAACQVESQGADKGCDPDSATPRCVVNTGCTKCNADNDDQFCKRVNNLKPKCNTGSGAESGKCEAAGTSAGTPATQASGGTTNDDGGATDSKGTTGKHSDTTSSAGSVTSTACLVIASVVVALMI